MRFVSCALALCLFVGCGSSGSSGGPQDGDGDQVTDSDLSTDMDSDRDAQPTQCAVAGVAYEDGAPNPANSCEVCALATSVVAFSPVVDGTVCGQGQFCRAGFCKGAWTTIAPIGMTAVSAVSASAASNGKIYIFSGSASSPLVQVFDPSTSAITTGTAPGFDALQSNAVATNDGVIYLFGGAGNTQIWVYTVATGNALLSSFVLPSPSDFSATLGGDGRAYLFGLTSAGSVTKIFDGSSLASDDGPTVGRGDTVAIRMPDGRIGVFGGSDGANARTTVEFYDATAPAGSRWTSGADMPRARTLFVGALRSDGRVVLASGIIDGVRSKSTDVYDPTTDAWTAGPDLNAVHFSAMSARTPDGRIWIIGGRDADANATAVIEVAD